MRKEKKVHIFESDANRQEAGAMRSWYQWEKKTLVGNIYSLVGPSNPLLEGLANFFNKGPNINISVFADHLVCVTTQLCYNTKAAIHKKMNLAIFQ